MLDFQTFQFTREIIVPRPVIKKNDQLGLLMIATPWGEDHAVKIFFEEVEQYLTSAMEDGEVTSLFERIESMEKKTNDLRIAALLANDKIFRSVNSKDFSSALEATLLVKIKNKLYWSVIGGHQLVFQSNQLTSKVSSQISTQPTGLPTSILGVDEYCTLIGGSYQLKKNDKVWLQSNSIDHIDYNNQSSLKEKKSSSVKLGSWVVELKF